MLNQNFYANGSVKEQWDDGATPRTYTAWDTFGALVPGTPRGYTPAENTAADARAANATMMANLVTLQQKAATALANNATYLAIPSPTQAQAVTQVGALTRQVNGIMRILNSLTSTIADS